MQNFGSLHELEGRSKPAQPRRRGARPAVVVRRDEYGVLSEVIVQMFSEYSRACETEDFVYGAIVGMDRLCERSGGAARRPI